VLNGVSYFTNTIIYLPSGNYILYAQPDYSNETFNEWQIQYPTPPYFHYNLNQNITIDVNASTVTVQPRFCYPAHPHYLCG
jgi:hypothetical protein